jgi:hypothetical protein
VSAQVQQVAEAMYQASRAATRARSKSPETLDGVNPASRRRYLMLAEAAVGAMTEPPEQR